MSMLYLGNIKEIIEKYVRENNVTIKLTVGHFFWDSLLEESERKKKKKGFINYWREKISTVCGTIAL